MAVKGAGGMKQGPTDKSAASAWRLVWASVRRGKGLVIGGLASITVLEALSLYSPQLIKRAVDQLADGRASASSLLYLAGLTTGLAALVALLRMLGRPLLLALGRRVERDLRDSLVKRLLARPQSFFDSQTSGQVMARATYDLSNLRLAAGYGLQAAWDSVLVLALALAYMLWLSPVLTLLAGLPMIAIPWLTRRQSILFHGCHQEIQASFSALSEEANDSLGAIRLVKAYDLAKAKQEVFGDLAARHRDHNLELARVTALYLPIMTLVTNLSLAVVWGAGGALAVLGRVSPGDIVAFSAYVAMMKTPLVYSGYLINLTQRARSSAQRLQDILQGTEEQEAVLAPRPRSSPHILIRDLSFHYPGEARPVLSGLDLSIEPGGHVALVGPVGSGKSTLLKLLAGLYPAPDGAIILGGRDAADMSEPRLRCLVGMVPQDPFVFSATVQENLALARADADPEDQWRALAVAGLDDEVRALPQGIDTELGEQGHTLSGGQRARLAVAQALLRDPPILLLDDPLSAVDPVAEERIMRRLSRIRAGKTTLIVSHRPGSLAFAETTLVLDQGRLSAQGAHGELLAASPLYRRLVQREELSRRVEGGDG